MTINRRELVAAAGAVLVVGDLAKAGSPADLTLLTLAGAARGIAARELTSERLAWVYLARIAQINPRSNAYITVTAEADIAGHCTAFPSP